MAVLEKLQPVLEEGNAARSIDFNKDEQKIVKGLFLLTSKPVIYVANIAEDSMSDPDSDKYFQIVKKHAEAEGAEALGISAATEEEIAGMDDDEKKDSLKWKVLKNQVWIV